MEKDEKFIEAINYIKEQQKISTDFVTKGVLLHLAITAFSITLYFQGKNVPTSIIQVANIMLTSFAAFFCVLIYKEGKRINQQISELFSQIDVQINNFRIKSWYWVSIACVILCSLL